MRVSVLLSLLLHGGAVAALLLGVIPARDRDSLYVPPVPIEVIREAELSEILSVPEMVEAPEPEEADEPAPSEEVIEPEPVAEPEPAPEPEPEPEPLPDPEPTPEPEPEPEPEPQPQPEPPQPQPRPEPPKPAEDELDFGDLGAALKDLDPDKQDRAAPRVVNDGAATADRTVARVGTGDQLTIREEDLFRARMYECWNPDLGVPNATELFVEV